MIKKIIFDLDKMNRNQRFISNILKKYPQILEIIGNKYDTFQPKAFCYDFPVEKVIVNKEYLSDSISHLSNFYKTIELEFTNITKEIHIINNLGLNKINNINLINEDVKNIVNMFNYKFDIITCNPPYFKYSEDSLVKESEYLKIARHEVKVTLDEVVHSANVLLKDGGTFAMVHRVERLMDILEAFRNNGIEPKTLRFVSKTPNDAPWLFLIEGRKGGKAFMKVLPQLYINGADGFSEELLNIYKGEKH